MLAVQPQLKRIRSAADAEQLCCGEIGAMLTAEGTGDAVEERTWMIPLLGDLGVRIFGLTWNYGNPLACGCLDTADEGLRPAGRETLKILHREKMVFTSPVLQAIFILFRRLFSEILLLFSLRLQL